MAYRRYEKEAKEFCDAIRKLAALPDNLDNLESYLSGHFGVWLERYANTPETITSELQGFTSVFYS